MASRYLTAAHRDNPSTGCAFAALGSDAGEVGLDDAIALMAICVGGGSLARAVHDKDFSARILRVARGRRQGDQLMKGEP